MTYKLNHRIFFFYWQPILCLKPLQQQLYICTYIVCIDVYVEIYYRPLTNAAICLATLLAIYFVVVGEYGTEPNSVCCTHKRQENTSLSCCNSNYK